MSNRDIIKLSTGREFYANHGLVSISLTDGDKMEVAEGYDGGIYMEEDPAWTYAERIELAELMIKRWKDYKVRMLVNGARC